MARLTVTVFTPQELNHSSYIQTGLFELENDGYLNTKIRLSFAKRLGTIRIVDSEIHETNQPHPKTSFYKLRISDLGKTVNFATDLYDAADSFSKYALDNCEFVFKRNFESSIVATLPIKYQKKIYPLGLTFGTHSEFRHGGIKLFTSLFISNLRISAKLDRYFVRRIYIAFKEQFQHWKFTSSTRLINSFDTIRVPSENTILFQTRCFPHENHEDAKSIHLQRFEIISLLRNKFGEKFKGGIIPSKLALKYYAEAMSNLPADPISYLQLVKNSKIGIYTRGLARSPAWKMAEYLAMGKVIIAEEMTTELPVPLEHGKTLLFFKNYKDLIENIDRVLMDDQLASTLSANARKYYEDHVHPKHNVKRIIEFMLNQKENE